MKSLLSSSLALTALSALTASAQIISVDLGAGTTVGGTAYAGVVSTDGWQQISAYPDFTNKAMNLSDGTASGATLSGDGSGNITSLGASTADANYSMYNRMLGIEGSGGASTLTVNGLSSDFTSSGYDVYVYFASAENYGVETRVTYEISDGTTTYYWDADETNDSYQGSFIQATTTSYSSGDAPIANYVKFSGLNTSTFTITSKNVDTVTASAAGFAGIQIVAIPEPGTVALVGAFGLAAGLMLIRRRRR